MAEPYLASYTDLMAAYGTNESLASHYVNYGYSEGRALAALNQIIYYLT